MSLYVINGPEGFERPGEASELWPETSFPPEGPNQDWLTEADAALVNEYLQHNGATEQLESVTPYLADDGIVYNVVVRPLPPVPDWLSFNDAVNQLLEVRQLLIALKDMDMAAAMALAVGLGQAAQGDPKTFLHVWAGVRAAGLVSPETAAEVEVIGRAHHLPEPFLATIIAPPPEIG